MKNIYIFVTILVIAKYGFSEELPIDAKKMNLSNRHYLEFYNDFSRFTELEEIDLSNNIFRDLNPTVFKKNHKLHTINLSGNKLLTFPAIGSFLESDAKLLNLSNCDLKIIGGNVLDDLKHLTILDLSHNPINFEESEGFQTMSHYPEIIIVSNISLVGIKYICRDKHTKIIVLEENKEVSCRDFTNKVINTQNGNIVPIIDKTDGMMVDENHLDIMLAEEPDMEGSGDSDMEEVHTYKEEKAEEPVEDKEVIQEDEIHDDEIIEPKIEEGIEKSEEISSGENKQEINNRLKDDDDIVTESVSDKKEVVMEEDEINADEIIEPKVEEDIEKSEEIITVGKKEELERIEKNKDMLKEDQLEMETGSASNKEDELVPIIFNRFADTDNVQETEKGSLENTKQKSDDSSSVSLDSESKESRELDKKSDKVMIKTRGSLGEKKTHAELLDGDKEYMIPIDDQDNESIASEASKTASSSSNAAVILVIIVALCGTAAVGYKCYKGKKNPYSSVNALAKENPTEGKELEVVSKLAAEKRPLMDGTEVVQNGNTETSKVEDVKVEIPEEQSAKN